MRILLTHLYDARYSMGGAEKVVLDLAQGLQRLHGEDLACAVNRGQLAEAMRASGIPVTEIYLKKSATGVTLYRLAQICRGWKPQLIHSHHRYSTFLLDAFFKSRIPVLHTEHVLRHDKKGLFRYGSFATAVHQTVADNLELEYKVPHQCLEVIPNAVPAREADPGVLEQLQKKHSRNRGEIFAVCIGRLEEQKGHTYLIDAVSRMTPRIRERLRIFLLGDGSLEASLRAQASSGGVSQVFDFVGHTASVSEYLALCDFMVLPSLWEGMPLSVLEAYGMEKPVLATDIPGTRELVARGLTGDLVPVRDAEALAKRLEAWVSAPERLGAMGDAAGQRWRNEYSFDVMVSRYRKLYMRLVSQGKS